MNIDSDTSMLTGDKPPIAIGGMGGSGTRLIALIIQELGYYIGNDLNEAMDNLLFTLLFRRKNILLEETETINYSFDLLIKSLRCDHVLNAEEFKFINSLAKGDRHHFDQTWFTKRVANAKEQTKSSRQRYIAWKEPNTHIFLGKLLIHNNDIKYVHVVRDGLDMAFSRNQNQLMMWGDCFLNRPVSKTPSDSLIYWNITHRRILDLKTLYPDRIIITSYDQICKKNKDSLHELYRFTDITPDSQQLEIIDSLIQPPQTLGRGKAQDTNQFDTEILEEYHQIMDAIINSRYSIA